MSDPVVLLLFLATWGGVILVFRRLADDLRKAIVRQSPQAPSVDEELLRITAEVQETVDGLGEALTRRAETLKTLIAEADRRIEALAETRQVVTPTPQPVAAAPTVLSEAEPVTALPDAEPEPVTVSSSGPLGGRAGADEVHRLAAAGHDPDTIARLTNRGREEVRILLRRAS